MTKLKLAGLIAQRESAEDRVKNALSAMYPEGSRWCFTMQYGQVNASRGSVIGHDASGHVRMRIDGSRTGHVRGVYYTNIIGPAA